jgi:zinc/manganese transport system substrate-binding protein
MAVIHSAAKPFWLFAPDPAAAVGGAVRREPGQSTIAPKGAVANTASASSNPASPATPKRPLQVVASFSILGDWVAQVGGDYVSVKTLIGANQDAHAFQPRPRDVQMIAAADLVVLNGLGFEGWSERLIHSANYQGAVVAASRGIQPLTPVDGAHHSHHHGADHDGDKSMGKGRGRTPTPGTYPANAAIQASPVSVMRSPPVTPPMAMSIAPAPPTICNSRRRRPPGQRGSLPVCPPTNGAPLPTTMPFNIWRRAFDLRFESPAGWSTGIGNHPPATSPA